ncbi:MAG: substrate-binding domain-containing protein, partial [Lysinibacillus sp.]
SVNINYFEAVYEAIQLFIQNGHSKIAFVSGTHEYTVTQHKLSAYKKVLEDAGITVDERYIVEDDGDYDSGIAAFTKLNALGDDAPTAYFAGSDEIAIGVIHGAQDKDISVPENIEVMSFENSKLARMVRPQLTSIVLPLYDIGAVAMRLLTKLINKEQVTEQSVILPHRIEMRDSVKK